MMPAVVLGLLGGHMIFIFTAITLGTGDPSFAVVPDYYEKAVDYDQRKALLAQSAELGWAIELTPAAQADAIGQRELFVRFQDSAGQPITGLLVQVTGYHVARAKETVTMQCVEVLPGQYVGSARMTREGFWQFAVDAEHGEERFASEARQFVTAAGGAP